MPKQKKESTTEVTKYSWVDRYIFLKKLENVLGETTKAAADAIKSQGVGKYTGETDLVLSITSRKGRTSFSPETASQILREEAPAALKKLQTFSFKKKPGVEIPKELFETLSQYFEIFPTEISPTPEFCKENLTAGSFDRCFVTSSSVLVANTPRIKFPEMLKKHFTKDQVFGYLQDMSEIAVEAEVE